MSKTAFLYAGQGSQHVGMGKDLCEAFPEFKEAFLSGDLSFDLESICFDDPEEKLSLTKYTQPCMVAFACGMTAVLKKHGLKPDYTAGLSLGEYSALACAQVLDYRSAINLTAFRGEAMTKASEGISCGMTAILGLDAGEIQKCCDASNSIGLVQICNYNCPGQIVIGGEKEAVDHCSELAQNAGARRCIPLVVSGPFHTSLMKPAGDMLQAHFQEITFNEPTIPVLFNCLGDLKTPTDRIPDLLVRQVQSPVHMDKTIERLFELGVTNFIEIGPGKALTGFIKKSAKALGIKDYTCHTLESVSDVQDLLDAYACNT